MSKTLPFLDAHGNQIVRPGKDYLYCKVYGEINTFEQEKILKTERTYDLIFIN
jgi:hypothetical protein